MAGNWQLGQTVKSSRTIWRPYREYWIIKIYLIQIISLWKWNNYLFSNRSDAKWDRITALGTVELWIQQFVTAEWTWACLFWFLWGELVVWTSRWLTDDTLQFFQVLRLNLLTVKTYVRYNTFENTKLGSEVCESTLDRYSGRINIAAYWKALVFRFALWHSITVDVKIGTISERKKE
jgi:hypothetical protein